MMTFLSPNLPDSHLYKMANIIYVFNGVKRERREEKEGRGEWRWEGERKRGEGGGLEGRGGEKCEGGRDGGGGKEEGVGRKRRQLTFQSNLSLVLPG